MPQRLFQPLHRAYTLVEVLVVVVILAILGAIVVPSMLTAGEMGVQAAARSVVADLLVAQNEAVAAQAVRTVHFDTTHNRYGLFDENDKVITASWKPISDHSFGYDNNDITTPEAAGKNFIVDLNRDRNFQGVAITNPSFIGPDTNLPRISFDALGAPLYGGGSVDLIYDRRRFRVNVADFTGRITIDEVTN